MDLLGEDGLPSWQLSPQLREPTWWLCQYAGTAGSLRTDSWQGNTAWLSIHSAIFSRALPYQIDPRNNFNFSTDRRERIGIYLPSIISPLGPATYPPRYRRSVLPPGRLLVWYPNEGGWNCRGFRVHRQSIEEISIIVNGGEEPQGFIFILFFIIIVIVVICRCQGRLAIDCSYKERKLRLCNSSAKPPINTRLLPQSSTGNLSRISSGYLRRAALRTAFRIVQTGKISFP